MTDARTIITRRIFEILLITVLTRRFDRIAITVRPQCLKNVYTITYYRTCVNVNYSLTTDFSSMVFRQCKIIPTGFLLTFFFSGGIINSFVCLKNTYRYFTKKERVMQGNKHNTLYHILSSTIILIVIIKNTERNHNHELRRRITEKTL